MAGTDYLVNAHLPGDSFFWQGGPVGVLLVHGFTATTAEVRLLAQALHQAGYTVAGPLLPGHGSTPFEANRCRWQDWAAAAETAYQQLQTACRQVVIGGESMGGLLALYLAAHHPEAPAVLTYAPALVSTSRPEQWFARLARYFVPLRAKKPSQPSAADPRWKGYRVIPMSAAVQLFDLQAEVLRRLPQVHQPLLVVQGRLDQSISPLGPALLVERVASQIKQVEWFEHSTHCVAIDGEWEQVAARTLSFLEQVLEEAK